MSKKIFRLFVILALFGAPFLTRFLLSQEGRLMPLETIKVVGEVSLIRGSDGAWVISPWFQITRKGNPVSGLEVSLEGNKLRETMPGQYAGIRITTITPVAGGKLSFAIGSKPVMVPGTLPKKQIAFSGTATIGSLIEITQPVSGSSIGLAGLGTILNAAWSGGTAPFSLGLLRNSGVSVLEIFSQNGLAGHSFSLPATLLAAGLSYDIVVSCNVGSFKFSKPALGATLLLDASSAVTLRCSAISAFSIH